MRVSRILLFSVIGGCSAEYGLDAKASDEADDVSPPDDTAEGDTDETGEPEEPAWYVARADLVVTDGVAVAKGAVISIEVIDADLERVDCVVDLTPDLVTAGTPDSIVWWNVSVSPTEEPCAPLPAVIALGIGVLHPDARARLGTVGHDDIADALYGAWLRADDSEPAAYGYAGTLSDLMGDNPATLPPPDGTYHLAPLYVVALPEP